MLQNNKILFTLNNKRQKQINIGDLFLLFNVAYHRGKELGYKYIFFEWPLCVRYFIGNRKIIGLECPIDRYLPINLLSRNDMKKYIYDKIINFNVKNSLYPGCLPIYQNRKFPFGKRNYVSTLSYLNMHYHNTGIYPEIKIPKHNIQDKYILFHFRNVNYDKKDGMGSTDRNVNPQVFAHLFKLMKKKYSNNYKFYKCGEAIKELDDKFDYVSPYYSNINGLLRLINNCSFFIVADSSPTSAADVLGIPRIRYECIRQTKSGAIGWHSIEYWKKHNGYGKFMNEWQNPNKYRMLFKGDKINDDDILEFSNEWLKEN